MSSSIEETSFAPTGKPEKILIKKTVKAFPESLKTFLENLSKNFPIYSTAPVRSKKEDKTKKGNIDAIKVFAQSESPQLIPEETTSGKFISNNITTKEKKKIKGK